jgi:hypothetical protein
MKIIILSAVLFAVSFTTIAQVGIGTINPEGALDVVSSNSGIILPRVANTAAVTSPVNGMLVYDLSSNCLKIYENSKWSAYLTTSTGTTVVSDCDQNGFEGSYFNGVVLEASNDFTISITNNNFSDVTIAFDTTDLVLSGTAIGTTSVVSVSPSSVNLTSGQSQVVSYQLSGTPVTGVLQADWSKLTLACSRTKTVDQNSTISFISAQLNANLDDVTYTKLLTSRPDEHYNSDSFIDWALDALDGGIKIGGNVSTGVYFPYTSSIGTTGGGVSTSTILGSAEYTTSFGVNRRLFAFAADVSTVSTIGIFSNNGIDSESIASLNGTFSTGGWTAYYSVAQKSVATDDAFVFHIAIIGDDITATFSVDNTTSSLQNNINVYSWTAGAIQRLYIFAGALGGSSTTTGPQPSVNDMETLCAEIITDVMSSL